MRVNVVNDSPEPIMLQDGTVLGAAHTPEARKDNVELSTFDVKRYCGRIRYGVGEVRQCEPNASGAPPARQLVTSPSKTTTEKGGK